MSSNSRWIAWAVWAIASIFYAYQYVLRVMPNVMLNDIMQQFNIGAGIFGQFSGVYYIGYSLLHLPVGIMLDRYGPRRIMSGCILLTVVGMLPLILAEHWIYPLAGRMLIGVGSSAAILGLFKIIRMSFSEERFPRMLSYSVTIGLMGAIYGGAPVGYMRQVFGYEIVVELLALSGVILAAVTYLVIPEEKSADKTALSTDIKEVLCNSRVIMACVFAGLMVGPMEGFADVWGTAFLKQVYGFDGATAASLPSLLFIGMCFGTPIINIVAEQIGDYLVTIIAAGVAMTACFTLVLTGSLSPVLLSASFVLVGVSCGYQILAIYKVTTFTRQQVSGLATAVANMIIMIFGYVFHTAMGAVITAMGGPESKEALTCGVAVVPVALAIGTVGFTVLYVFEKRRSQALEEAPADGLSC